jgi:hypothetical protein
MGTWLIIESYNRFGDPHTPCLVAVCPEELHGRKSGDIAWRIYSKDTQFETREAADETAKTTRGLQAFLPSLGKSQEAIELPCGCRVLSGGRASTCELWRKAGGSLGSEEKLFPAELYQEVRRHLVDLEWQRPKVWDRMEFGVSLVSDIALIAKKLRKHSEVRKKVLALLTPSTSPLYAPNKKKKDWTVF